MVVLLAHFGAPPPRRHSCNCSDANRRSKWSFCWPTLGHLRPIAKSPLCSDANHCSKWSFYWPTLGRLRPVAKSALFRALIIVANGCFYGPLSGAPACRQICTCSDANDHSKCLFLWPTSERLRPVAKLPFFTALIII